MTTFAHLDDRILMTALGPREISRTGFGVFPLTLPGRPSFDDSVEMIHLALDNGVTFLDTADSYHLPGEPAGYGEVLVRTALGSWSGDRDGILVATKGSRLLTDDGVRVSDGRPEYLRAACDASLGRLGTEAVDLYQLHRPDPAVPYEDSLGAMKGLYEAGKVKSVGISNANPVQIRMAKDILGDALVSVQNQFGPTFTTSLPEVELCAELGLVFIPWGTFHPDGDGISMLERFPEITEVAADKGVSPHRLVLGWVLAHGEHVVPIPGARRAASFLDSLQAVNDELSEDERARLDAAIVGEEKA